MLTTIKLTECPRDAMQGIKKFIPTDLKISYLQSLLSVGFDVLDFGSFVSPKAIPQMSDSAEVIEQLNLDFSPTQLLAIIANARGAEQASRFAKISYIGYPFSISETFQLRNTNASISESVETLFKIIDIAGSNSKKVMVYLSMAFGNPYGDVWNAEIVMDWVNKLQMAGIRNIALSDTIGVASPDSIHYLFQRLIPMYPDIEFGAHFHTVPDKWKEKLEAAYHSGCTKFDAAIGGFGGCPMAKDELTGNMPTEQLIRYFKSMDLLQQVDTSKFEQAQLISSKIFNYYH